MRVVNMLSASAFALVIIYAVFGPTTAENTAKLKSEIDKLQTKFPSQPRNTWSAITSLVCPMIYGRESGLEILLLVATSESKTSTDELASHLGKMLRDVIPYPETEQKKGKKRCKSIDYSFCGSIFASRPSAPKFYSTICEALVRNRVITLYDIQNISSEAALSLLSLTERNTAPVKQGVLILTIGAPATSLCRLPRFVTPLKLVCCYLKSAWGKDLSDDLISTLAKKLSHVSVIVEREM